MNKLQEQYENLIDEYGEDRIIWVAAIGYTVNKSNITSDDPITACYLPTEEELRAEIENQKTMFNLQHGKDIESL